MTKKQNLKLKQQESSGHLLIEEEDNQEIVNSSLYGTN
jgi:hypothetical protein